MISILILVISFDLLLYHTAYSIYICRSVSTASSCHYISQSLSLPLFLSHTHIPFISDLILDTHIEGSESIEVVYGLWLYQKDYILTCIKALKCLETCTTNEIPWATQRTTTGGFFIFSKRTAMSGTEICNSIFRNNILRLSAKRSFWHKGRWSMSCLL